MKNLYFALNYFNGESGLDNMQIRKYLKNAFVSGKLSKRDIVKELCFVINEPDFDWADFVKDFNWFYNLDEYSNSEIKDYVIDLVCDLILTIDTNFLE